MAKTPKGQICIVTVIGVDKVGIIAKLAVTMANANINIVDVNQRIMENYFVMTMAVDVAGATVPMDKLKQRLDRIAKSMVLNITIQDERIFEVMHRV
ncbi:ACT domain-containing protein [Planctomycetota bacterium]